MATPLRPITRGRAGAARLGWSSEFVALAALRLWQNWRDRVLFRWTAGVHGGLPARGNRRGRRLLGWPGDCQARGAKRAPAAGGDRHDGLHALPATWDFWQR